MTILITGGTGKTGSVLARLLHNANHKVLLTSRTGTAPAPFKAVTFDWFDPATHQNPFNADPEIDKVYLVGPQNLDRIKQMGPFIDLAIEKGVKRFIALTSTLSEPGVPGPGEVHEYILKKGVDYAVLRPSWFIENFQTVFLQTIREQNMIASTLGDGKVPFIAVNDISEIAFEALTAEKSPNKDYYILGPEFLGYDEAAEIFSEVLGRTIVHKKLTVEEGKTFWTSVGLSPEFASGLVQVEQLCANGAELNLGKSPNARIGKRSLRAYIEANKALWQPL